MKKSIFILILSLCFTSILFAQNNSGYFNFQSAKSGTNISINWNEVIEKTTGIKLLDSLWNKLTATAKIDFSKPYNEAIAYINGAPKYGYCRPQAEKGVNYELRQTFVAYIKEKGDEKKISIVICLYSGCSFKDTD